MGFLDRVGSGGNLYALPSGVYVFNGTKTCREVGVLAAKAAHTTGRAARVLVTESAGMWAFGLEEYKTDDELLKEMFEVKP